MTTFSTIPCLRSVELSGGERLCGRAIVTTLNLSLDSVAILNIAPGHDWPFVRA